MNKKYEEELYESAINNTLNPLQDNDTYVSRVGANVTTICKSKKIKQEEDEQL